MINEGGEVAGETRARVAAGGSFARSLQSPEEVAVVVGPEPRTVRGLLVNEFPQVSHGGPAHSTESTLAA